MSRRTRVEAPRPEINITPLVDVVLVLLIIFMVVTPYLQNAVDLTLPDASNSETAAEVPQDPLSVSITRDGRTYVAGDEVSDVQLASAVDVHLRNSTAAPILVRADEQVAYRTVRHVFNSLRARGARAVALATETPGGD